MKWGIIGLGKIANKAAETFSFLRQEGETLTAVASRDIDKAKNEIIYKLAGKADFRLLRQLFYTNNKDYAKIYSCQDI